MKFTKEEIVIAKAIVIDYNQQRCKGNFSGSFEEFCDLFLKPGRKKIVVEIEYEVSKDAIPLTANNLQTHFEIATELKNPKATELPEVFSRQDILEMLKDCLHSDTIKMYCDLFISERNKKEPYVEIIDERKRI